jgi:signal transduction histidine kinase
MRPATHSEANPTHSEERGTGFQDQKRSFLRMVSHELRTPLNSILGFSEILAAELYGPLGDPQYREYAEIIQDSGAKLLKLVNQVLEISRLEAGVADLDLDPVPLGAALEDALGMARDEICARDIRMSLDDDADMLVLADARGLRTVLANLIQNACAFSPKGGEVRILIDRRAGMIELVIEDDGEGVEADALSRLLRPFEHGESPATRRSAGSGLGLAICDLTCHAMGGRLELKSAPDEGFRAKVVLPAG